MLGPVGVNEATDRFLNEFVDEGADDRGGAVSGGGGEEDAERGDRRSSGTAKIAQCSDAQSEGMKVAESWVPVKLVSGL